MFWSRSKKEPDDALPDQPKPRRSKNPHLSRSFFSSDTDYQLSGWTVTTETIDKYLASDLAALVARSREAFRLNPYAKQFIRLLKSNVVGPIGVTVQARSKYYRRGGANRLELDRDANRAIERAWLDWSQKENCDFLGRSSWMDMQNLAISSAGKNGEFIFQTFIGGKGKYGKYGFQLKSIDPSSLDVTLNQLSRGGGEIRMGVEYDSEGRCIRYHFIKKSFLGGGVDRYSLPADSIIHGFISEEEGQSRGIPWMHAGLSRQKNLEKYDETVMIASRYGASKMVFLRSDEGEPGDEYEGDDVYDDHSEMEIHPGIEDIGNKHIEQFDPKYPHEVYTPYTKQVLRAIAAGLGVSYHSLSSDLEGVNYSSLRTGALEDREIYKGLQNWFIEQLVRPVYKMFVRSAILKGAIKLDSGRPLSRSYETYFDAHYQGRRWAWVDPQKDGNANNLSIDNRTRSRSSIIREQGGDPDDVFAEIAADEQKLKDLKILPEKEESHDDENEEIEA